MASTYLLKNLDHRDLLACLGERPASLDASALQAYVALLRVAGAILAATDAQLARRSISQGRLRLLAQLRLEGDAGTAPHRLADRIGVARATITRLLDGLERDRLIERRPSPRDGRASIVRLSPRGRSMVASLLPQRLKRIQALMAGLDAADKKRLVALLERVEANLGRFAA